VRARPTTLRPGPPVPFTPLPSNASHPFLPRTRPSCYPAVRRRSCCAHASQRWSSYCGVNTVLLLHREDREPPGYKGRLLTSRAHAVTILAGTLPPLHVTLQSLPPPSGVPSPFPLRYWSTPCHPVPCHGRELAEQEVQRLAPVVAAAGHHRSRPNPNFRHTGEPLALLLPFPDRPYRRSRRILAGTAAPMARGPNCIPLFFLGSFMRTRSMVVNLKNFPGSVRKLNS
jgi:hypothetical protein